ncbi:glycerate kinase [Microbacterium marmarense]|uniref:Glycerate kinase n=1 Tax=Microbacterium marmarense TaxID=3122051 RepID=A0ABU8LSE6_9MICO
MAHTVVIAPDSFKGTLAAADAAVAIGRGWHAVSPHDVVHLMPMADGGEGTLAAFEAAVPGARRMPVSVTGPENTVVAASWLLLPASVEAPRGTGVVELASTSGIELLGTPSRLRPLDAHTRGFGEAIAAALAHGVSRLVLGIGSSASTDGGAGMLSALGARLLSAHGDNVADGGRGLADVATVDLTGLAALPPGGVHVLSDVTNPLLGAGGAAAVFGPQKGASVDQTAELDAALARFASLVNAADVGGEQGRPKSGVELAAMPGAGAAGGTGFGLLVWGARLAPGSDAVAELIGLREAVASSTVVITGEGSFDGQSAAGKVPAHVSTITAGEAVPVALVAGRITVDADTSAFASSVSLTELAGSAEAAMRDPARWLIEAGATLARRLA